MLSRLKDLLAFIKDISYLPSRLVTRVPVLADLSVNAEAPHLVETRIFDLSYPCSAFANHGLRSSLRRSQAPCPLDSRRRQT